MLKICCKMIGNQLYIDKDFIKNFGIDNVEKYGYSIIEIDDKYYDCVAEDFYGLRFDIEKYNKRKLNIDNANKISSNLKRMDELSKDFIQAYVGASIPDIDIKKQEFVRLHNEVRSLTGKEPRVYYL